MVLFSTAALKWTANTELRIGELGFGFVFRSAETAQQGGITLTIQHIERAAMKKHALSS